MTRAIRRRTGRPARGVAVVDRAAILGAARALVARGGVAALTMRALAARLGVDAMAPYHYFRDKDAILRAVADQAYAQLAVRVAPGAGWQAQVLALATSYLAVLTRSGDLVRYLATHAAAAAAPARVFDDHFRAAVAPLRLSPARYRVARAAVVDLVHGFALAARPRARSPGARALRAELALVLAGIAAAR